MNTIISSIQKEDLYITKHAYERLKKRAGLAKKAAERISLKAYTNGIRQDEVTGRLYSYLAEKARKDNRNEGSHRVRIYGEMVYVFSVCDERNLVSVITAFQLPNDLKHQARGCFRKKKAA